MAVYITLRIHGEEWIAYETDSARPDRRWSLQATSLRNALGIVAFYAASLDAAVSKIKHGRP